MKRKKILLTGGTGFVGLNLLRALKEKGLTREYFFVLTSRNPDKVRSEVENILEGENIKLVKLSLLERDSLSSFLKEIKPFMVLHLAGITKALKAKDFYLGNHLATKNLVENLPRETQFLLYLSSQAASRPGINISENEESAPVSHYGKSKLLAEREIEKFHGKWIVLRPVSIFGEGDKDFLRAITTVKKLKINLVVANNRVSLIYVRDVAKAIIYFSKKLMNGELHREKIFITSGYAPTTKELGKIWGDILGIKVKTINIPPPILKLAAFFSTIASYIKRKPDIFSIYKVKELRENWVASPEKMLSTGFKPEYFESSEIRKAWEKTIHWYIKKGLL